MHTTDIILIEDDPLIGEIARDILTGAGYTVRLVPDPLDAMAAIKKVLPKLVITDIMMPGISGMDLCKMISSDPGLAGVKVMVMSAKSFEAEIRRAKLFGAVHFLPKPFTEKGLVDTVKKLLGGHTDQPAPKPAP